MRSGAFEFLEARGEGQVSGECIVNLGAGKEEASAGFGGGGDVELIVAAEVLTVGLFGVDAAAFPGFDGYFAVLPADPGVGGGEGIGGEPVDARGFFGGVPAEVGGHGGQERGQEVGAGEAGGEDQTTAFHVIARGQGKAEVAGGRKDQDARSIGQEETMGGLGGGDREFLKDRGVGSLEFRELLQEQLAGDDGSGVGAKLVPECKGEEGFFELGAEAGETTDLAGFLAGEVGGGGWAVREGQAFRGLLEAGLLEGQEPAAENIVRLPQACDLHALVVEGFAELVLSF